MKQIIFLEKKKLKIVYSPNLKLYPLSRPGSISKLYTLLKQDIQSIESKITTLNVLIFSAQFLLSQQLELANNPISDHESNNKDFEKAKFLLSRHYRLAVNSKDSTSSKYQKFLKNAMESTINWTDQMIIFILTESNLATLKYLQGFYPEKERFFSLEIDEYDTEEVLTDINQSTIENDLLSFNKNPISNKKKKNLVMSSSKLDSKLEDEQKLQNSPTLPIDTELLPNNLSSSKIISHSQLKVAKFNPVEDEKDLDLLEHAKQLDELIDNMDNNFDESHESDLAEHPSKPNKIVVKKNLELDLNFKKKRNFLCLML